MYTQHMHAMGSTQITFRMPDEMLEEIEEKRGSEWGELPRSYVIKKAIRMGLDAAEGEC